jgi:hypothetical protein
MKKHLHILLLLVLPYFVVAQANLVLVNGYVVMANGTAARPVYLELNNSSGNAIMRTGGWIISESEFNMVKWDIGNSTGNYTLPFGYSTTAYIPLSFNVITAGTPAAGSIKFSTYHTMADNWTCCPPSDVTNMAPVLPALSQPTVSDDSWLVVDRFWIIDANTGYTTKPSPNLKFSYIDNGVGNETAAPNAFSENTLIAQRFNSVLGLWGDYFGTTGTDVAGPPTSTCMNDPVTAISPADFFRSWTLSSSTSPLPIQLTAFNVSCNNGEANITWTTQTETNNDYFTVERSIDGINYETVTTVKGAGNSSSPITYTAIDAQPLPGTSYYRLSQTDFDGKTTHNNPIAFNGCSLDGTTISAFCWNNAITARINAADADNYTMTLCNLTGQVIWSDVKSLPAGYSEVLLNPGSLSYSIYVLNINSNRISYNKKLVLGNR